MISKRNLNRGRMAALFLVAALTLGSAATALANGHTSRQFIGPKANKGTVTHSKVNGHHVLTVSSDFVVPDTPAPHWQVIDSKGNVYLLQQLRIKDNKFNLSITVPAYVKDIAKVQIWCSWAETLLGEASFDTVQK